MSLRIARAVAETENLDDLHLARILILLSSADDRKKTADTKAQAVEGITKLAKLDFFLRYPTYLERALEKLGKDAGAVGIEPRERHSIETTMVRFRYGPWDARYRRWLGLLHARGLVTLGIQGNTVMIGLTRLGKETSAALRDRSDFESLARRSDLIALRLGKLAATKLKNFTYEVVPEIIAMKWGQEIALGGSLRRADQRLEASYLLSAKPL